MNLKTVVLWITILLMVLSAAVQLNDPDPMTWIAAYLLVAFIGLRKVMGKNDKSLWVAALVYIIWGVNVYPPEWEGVLLNEVGMKTLNIELGRESFGLFICAVILLFYEFY